MSYGQKLEVIKVDDGTRRQMRLRMEQSVREFAINDVPDAIACLVEVFGDSVLAVVPKLLRAELQKVGIHVEPESTSAYTLHDVPKAVSCIVTELGGTGKDVFAEVAGLLLEETLKRTGGVQRAAAKVLGVSPLVVHRRKKMAMKLLPAALCLCLLLGCATKREGWLVQEHPKAVMEALSANEAGYLGRVAVGVGTDGKTHTTGQALISGEWVDLSCVKDIVSKTETPELTEVLQVITGITIKAQESSK